MWERIESGLKRGFLAHPRVTMKLPTMQDQVRAGQLPASVAARQLLQGLFSEGAT
jgi:LAO/AO transport system kinase